MPPAAKPAARVIRPMLPLFAAVFIDLFSFGLMYPVIVALFHRPAIDALYSAPLRTLYLSLAFSLFPAGMFFGASLLGDLSDALGRRRTLLICMAGLGCAYGLMLVGVQTRALAWFLAGRLLSGLMAGTGPIAQAAMMDHSSEAERGRNMSHVVLVNCLALVAGPTLGGLLGHVDFRAPLAFAIVLCGVAFAWIALATPDAARPRAAMRLSLHRPFQVFAKALANPVIRPLAASFFLFQFGFAIYYLFILIRMRRDYGLSTAGLGLFSGMMGAGFVIGSTLAYARAKRLLERDDRVARLGVILVGVLLAASALPLPAPAQWLLAACACTANLLAYIGLLTLISAAASADEQGWALGIGSSVAALAFFLSGLLPEAQAFAGLPTLLALGGVLALAAAVPLTASQRGDNLARRTA